MRLAPRLHPEAPYRELYMRLRYLSQEALQNDDCRDGICTKYVSHLPGKELELNHRTK